MAKHMGIKKKIILGWLGFEALTLMLALPALGQITHRVKFEALPRAAHVLNEISPGESELLIASNAPFMVISQGVSDEMKLDLQVNGYVNGVAFGKNAQNPGPIASCKKPETKTPAILYLSVRKTAANRGQVIDQAVKITIRHDPKTKPKFSVVTLDQKLAKIAKPAPNCSIKISSAQSFFQKH